MNEFDDLLEPLERAVIIGLANGMEYKEIAEDRHISVYHARKLASRAFGRLGVHNAPEACYRWGRGEAVLNSKP